MTDNNLKNQTNSSTSPHPSQQKVWLKNYPPGVDKSIHLNQFQSINDIFSTSIEKFSSNPSFSNMGKSLSYKELNDLVSAFAAFLQNELQLKKGDRIAIQMPNLLQFPVALFAAFKVGLVVVNTNPLYTPSEMRHQLKDSGAKSIIILANFAKNLEEIISETDIQSIVITEIGDLLPFPKRWIVNSVVKYIKKMVPPFRLPQSYTWTQALEIGRTQKLHPVNLQQTDIAFLQYTGGTTGVSKGAELTHQNIIANMLQILTWMKPLLVEGKEVIVTALPLYHIFSLTVNCLTFMTFGGENVLITNPRDIGAFIKILKQHKFTVITGVNTLFNALMNHKEFTQIDFSSCKISVAGAMALQKAVADRWKKLTKTPLFEGYGLTEASPVVCCNPIHGNLDQVGTIGMPLPDTLVKIVNDQNEEVPQGQEGELCVQGPQVMKGYHGRPDETAKVLSNGWLKTGDIAMMLENGYFKIVDRKKDMILVSGFNVYPNEVEDVIASHPGVLEVAAVGVPDENSGEIVKVFVVKKDPQVTESEIIQYAKKSLTAYKVPKKVEFRNELPKTNVGKILRRALRDS